MIKITIKFIIRDEFLDWTFKAFDRDFKKNALKLFNNKGRYSNRKDIHNYEMEDELNSLYPEMFFIVNELCPWDGVFSSYGHFANPFDISEDTKKHNEFVCEYYNIIHDNDIFMIPDDIEIKTDCIFDILKKKREELIK